MSGGITFVAAAGDNGAYDLDTGYLGVEYPASSANVLAVGGTTLDVNGDNYVSETGWDGGGGGISSQEMQPEWQKGVVSQTTTMRTVPDVSMEAAPCSGVPIFDSWDFGASTPWLPGSEAGTSLAAPMWAGLVAIADQGRAAVKLSSLDGTTQTLPSLYRLPASDFHDVTAGNNGYAAAKGYDLVTGRGSPIANTLVPDLAGCKSSTTANRPVITALKASTASVASGKYFKLTATGVTDTRGSGIESVAFYRESNGASGLQTAQVADKLVGTATAGSSSSWGVTIATSGLSAGTYTFYAIATDKAGITSAAVPTKIVVTPAGAASYIGTDYMTEGNWKGRYGSEGAVIFNDFRILPSYATVTTAGSAVTYASSTNSISSLERRNSGRIASALSGAGSVSVGLDLTDGLVHKVAFYLLNWRGKGAASETVSILDASTGAVLANQMVSGYANGKYVVFNVNGNLTVRITTSGKGTPILSGLFLDPAKK